ncbi:hypothetical protein BCR42DRAFT_412220 [Absidia repens]|uniref:Zn(2)-C6 fungal-type domain-containing protein n=1 Tax=Absidia repens TaxID=90262 RepID=A0A1X2IJD1_9FUNG|nr:hypothetical protein BCR42DRAFT_412220 [Absidia repens]
MARIRPCENCKRRRRKCERASGATTCVRCSRLNLDCIFDTRPIDNSRYNTSSSRDSTKTNYELAEVDGDDELEDLCQYVKTLEEEMKQLQLNLDQQRQRNDSTQQQSLIRRTESQLDSIPLPKEWNLTFVNGHLRLETGINKLSDLLRYRHIESESAKPIRYLSPFNSSTPIQFQLRGETMICKVVFLLTQHEVFSGSLDTLTDNSTYSLFNHRRQNNFKHATTSSSSSPNGFTVLSPSSPLPSASSYTNGAPSPPYCDTTSSNTVFDKMSTGTTSYCPELLVSSLVQQYFQCFNPVMPLVHESTFMTHYFKQPPIDPDVTGATNLFESQPFSSSSSSSCSSSSSSSVSSFLSPSSYSATNDFISQHGPVTLAICCFMCLTYCKHLPFTSHQKRQYGEYYYVACREQIDDLYDDPSLHRQLEALISINLLYKFMAMTLRLRDSRKLATIGFLLSVELSKHAAQPDSLFTDVEKELVSRHSIMASVTFSMVEFICVKRMDDIVPFKVSLNALPGESDITVSMLELYTRFCDLALHNDSIVMVQQIRRVTIGQVGQVNLEAMVRFEQTCLNWWKNLPDKWRYCDHPYDSSAKHAIEQCEFDQALMAHSAILVLTLGVYSSLINPQNSQNQVSDMIQKRAVMVTLTCCELLMALADRMKVVTQYCGFSCDYLLRVYDSLYCLLSHSRKTDDVMNIPRLLNHISRLLNSLDGVIAMDNKVPSDMAPAPTEMTPPLSSSFIEATSNGLSTRINPAVYTRYPLPGHALLFDLVSSTANDIGMSLS